MGETGGEETRVRAAGGVDISICSRACAGPIRHDSRTSCLRGMEKASTPEGARLCKTRTLDFVPEPARLVIASRPSGRRGCTLDGEESRPRGRRSGDRSGKNVGKNWPDRQNECSRFCRRTGMDCLDLLNCRRPSIARHVLTVRRPLYPPSRARTLAQGTKNEGAAKNPQIRCLFSLGRRARPMMEIAYPKVSKGTRKPHCRGHCAGPSSSEGPLAEAGPLAARSNDQQVAFLADPGHERREETRDGPADSGKRSPKGLCHFQGAVVALAEGQLDRVVLRDGVELKPADARSMAP